MMGYVAAAPQKPGLVPPVGGPGSEPLRALVKHAVPRLEGTGQAA